MNRHESQRGYFAYSLWEQMKHDKKINLLVGDLGYSMWDSVRDDFPDRFYNVGASEQLMVGCAVGMAQEGLKPFCYSITPFLLNRPHEWIRNYLDHELAPVRLVGGGRDGDYSHDGYTHHAYDAEETMRRFENIKRYFPEDKDEIPDMVELMVREQLPSFISLQR